MSYYSNNPDLVVQLYSILTFRSCSSYNHNVCKRACGEITKIIDYITNIPIDILDKYCVQCVRCHDNYNENALCVPLLIKILTKLESSSNISNATMDTILKKSLESKIVSIMDVIKNKKHILPIQILDMCLINKNYNAYITIIKDYEPSSDNMMNIIKYNKFFSFGNDEIIKILKMYVDNGIKITSKIICQSLDVYHSNKCNEDPIINFLLKNNPEFDKECLLHACHTLNPKYIERVLTFKFQLTNDVFEAIFHKIKIDGYNHGKHLCANIVAEIIDLLVSYGYRITKENVMYALTRGCHVNNLENHGIKLSSDYYTEATKICYWPYQPECEIPIECLYMMCEKLETNEKSLKEFIEMSKLKPNLLCLQKACKIYNRTIIRFLIVKCKIIPDVVCLINCSNALSGNVTLKLIANNICDTNVTSKKKLKNVAKKIRKNVAKKIRKVDRPIKTVDEECDEEEEEYDEEDEVKDECEDEVEDGFEESEELKDKKQIIIIDPSDKMPKNKRSCAPITIKASKLLKFNEKAQNPSGSFIRLRKLMLDYLSNNNLFAVGEKGLIKINAELADTFTLDINKYLSMDQIDNLISQCFM